MNSEVRKICFDAQELMHAILTQHEIKPYEGKIDSLPAIFCLF